MPSRHLILYCPLFLLLPIPPSIRVFSNESTPLMRWPKYWSFSFSIIPSREHSGLISFRMVGSPCSRHVLNLRSITLSPLGRFPGSEAPEGPTLMLWAPSQYIPLLKHLTMELLVFLSSRARTMSFTSVSLLYLFSKESTRHSLRNFNFFVFLNKTKTEEIAPKASMCSFVYSKICLFHQLYKGPEFKIHHYSRLTKKEKKLPLK